MGAARLLFFLVSFANDFSLLLAAICLIHQSLAESLFLILLINPSTLANFRFKSLQSVIYYWLGDTYVGG